MQSYFLILCSLLKELFIVTILKGRDHLEFYTTLNKIISVPIIRLWVNELLNISIKHNIDLVYLLNIDHMTETV